MTTTQIETLVRNHQRQTSTGGPEAYVSRLTDAELRDTEKVRRMTRGLHWEPEPERFEAAAKAELAWRAEHGLEFGWRRA